MVASEHLNGREEEVREDCIQGEYSEGITVSEEKGRSSSNSFKKPDDSITASKTAMPRSVTVKPVLPTESQMSEWSTVAKG